MADVTGDDRSQLILVGGIVIAFGLVALVLLLNTALFTENVATRGLGPAPDRATDHATTAERAAERILRHEEHIEYRSWPNAAANTTRNIGRVDQIVRARQFQEHGAFATVEVKRVRRGAALVQTNRSRNFTANGNVDDWTLADTAGLRNFTMTVDGGNTTGRSTPGTFTLVMTGGSGNRWVAKVYRNGSSVEVQANDNAPCISSREVATINWTEGTLNGCSFPFAVNDTTGKPLEGPYQLTFRNGSNATGTYHLVVINETVDDVRESNFGAPNSSADPRLFNAVYSVRLAVQYDESTIDFQTHLRAAPGEPEQTSPAS